MVCWGPGKRQRATTQSVEKVKTSHWRIERKRRGKKYADKTSERSLP